MLPLMVNDSWATRRAETFSERADEFVQRRMSSALDDRNNCQDPVSLDSDAHYRFLHITKTGGTAISKQLANVTGTAACPDLIGCGHLWTAKDAWAHLQRPVAVLREPWTRLYSAYEYWRHGGAEYPDHLGSGETRNFVAFLHDARTPGSWADRLVRGITRNKYVWELHFAPQSHWLNRGLNATVVVCYRSGAEMQMQLTRTFEQVGIRCALPALPVTNAHRVSEGRSSAAVQAEIEAAKADPGSREWFERRYHEDITLFNRFCAETASGVVKKRRWQEAGGGRWASWRWLGMAGDGWGWLGRWLGKVGDGRMAGMIN